MKPYGKNKELASSRKIHGADKCVICGTQEWKVLKKRERRNWKKNID